VKKRMKSRRYKKENETVCDHQSKAYVNHILSDENQPKTDNQSHGHNKNNAAQGNVEHNNYCNTINCAYNKPNAEDNRWPPKLPKNNAT
jgi:hypothetical protein